jgi:F420-dependent oxidoreductase-like protein
VSQFDAGRIVSSDRLRELVGEGEHDQRAGKDAFDVLDLVVERRLRRRLLTVVDTLGLDAKRRQAYLEASRRHDLPCVAIAFDTPPEVCRARNRDRAHRVPDKVLAGMLRTWPGVRDGLEGEGFDAVCAPGDVEVVPAPFLHAPAFAARQEEEPMPLAFDLQISRFTWPGSPGSTPARLADIASTAEEIGVGGLWVMDHFLQIPQVGPVWEDMLDSYTTLAFLAGRTSTVRLGALVTGITYRNVGHLGKIVATLDVLSGGRAVCGLGAAWYEREHRAYGWDFPPVRERFELLEDALQALPLLWGKGNPSFTGTRISIPDTTCYPRPLQEHVPIVVGGSGERRTLRLVAQHADACNLFGDAATVRHKREVLAGHCAAVGRDPAEVEVTQLSTVAWDGGLTAQDHIGRFRELAEAGVQRAIVSLDLTDDDALERMAEVVSAFS